MDIREALAARDMGAVITIFRRWTGASQTEVGVLLGMSQPHVSDFERGIRHATSLAMFERFGSNALVTMHSRPRSTGLQMQSCRTPC